MRYIMLVSVFAAAVTGSHAGEPIASASTTDAASAPAAIDPLFDCYQANSAWGYTLSGKLIDSQGKLWSYGKRGKAWLPTPIKQGDAVYLTAADLHEKFAEAKQAGSIDAKALSENAALIAKAMNGAITRADSGTRDAGTSACHAYMHDQTGQRYRDVELGTDGGVSDSRVSNSAPEAQTLLTWLTSVGVAK